MKPHPLFRPSISLILGTGLALLALSTGPVVVAQNEIEPRLVEPSLEGRLVEPIEDPLEEKQKPNSPGKPSGASVGDLRFEPPKGWKTLNEEGGVILLPPDATPKKGAFIAILPSEPLEGNFEAAFVQMLNTIHRDKKGVKGTKPFLQKLPGGVQMLVARVEAPEGEDQTTHRMYTAYLHERHVHTLMLSATDEGSFDRYYPAFRTLVSHLSFEEKGRSDSGKGTGEAGPGGGERSGSRPDPRGEQDSAPVTYPAATVQWENRPTNLNLARGGGITLEYAEKAAGEADLRMTGTHLTSDTGEFMILKGEGSILTREESLKKLASVPAGSYSRRIPIESNLFNLVVLRMRDGRYAKLQFGSIQQELGSVGSGAVFSVVSIQYDMSRPIPPQKRRPPGPLDSRLVGTWNLFIPGGFSPDPARPGQRPTESFTPGAGSGTLTISANGKYTWNRFGKTLNGTLRRIRPGYAHLDRKFYAASDGTKEVQVTFTGEKTHYGDGLMVGYAEGKRVR